MNLLFVLPVCICAKVLNWSKVELGKLSFGIISTSYKSQSLLFASEEKWQEAGFVQLASLSVCFCWSVSCWNLGGQCSHFGDENFFFLPHFQVLQSKYPNLARVTDHLLDIFIHLTGDKYQASENSASGSSSVSEDASESRSENKKPNLEGRELSLRLSFLLCLLERNFVS